MVAQTMAMTIIVYNRILDKNPTVIHIIRKMATLQGLLVVHVQEVTVILVATIELTEADQGVAHVDVNCNIFSFSFKLYFKLCSSLI